MLVSAESRCSLHDGPGVRTVIYLKGCPLRCAWCHNPETWRAGKELLKAQSKCISCGRCACVCPEHHIIEDTGIAFHRQGCAACGKCETFCPTGALSVCGMEQSPRELLKTVLKDKAYYETSGGGVTLSGGEVLVQWREACELLRLCRENGVNTCVETSLFAEAEAVLTVAEQTDLVYADVKIPDGAKHRRYTGQDNGKIIENLILLTNNHGNVITRTPLIPKVNDSAEDAKGFAEILSRLGPGHRGHELLKYNNLAQSKYDRAGLNYTAFAREPQSDEEMLAFAKLIAGYLKTPKNIFFKGTNGTVSAE